MNSLKIDLWWYCSGESGGFSTNSKQYLIPSSFEDDLEPDLAIELPNVYKKMKDVFTDISFDTCMILERKRNILARCRVVEVLL